MIRLQLETNLWIQMRRKWHHAGEEILSWPFQADMQSRIPDSWYLPFFLSMTLYHHPERWEWGTKTVRKWHPWYYIICQLCAEKPTRWRAIQVCGTKHAPMRGWIWGIWNSMPISGHRWPSSHFLMKGGNPCVRMSRLPCLHSPLATFMIRSLSLCCVSCFLCITLRFFFPSIFPLRNRACLCNPARSRSSPWGWVLGLSCLPALHAASSKYHL